MVYGVALETRRSLLDPWVRILLLPPIWTSYYINEDGEYLMSEIKCPYCGSTNTVSKPKPEADKLMWYLLTPIVLLGICGMVYQLVAGTLPGAFYFLVLAGSAWEISVY